jgi:hypothetical protein
MGDIETLYATVLHSRGTMGFPGETGNSRPAAFDLPDDIRSLMQVQEGEDSIKSFGLGYRFLSSAAIAESVAGLRDMVEQDDTLPPAFLCFIPFVHTDCKTDVGLFTQQSPLMPGSVIEYHYETGEFVHWATSIPEFLSLLVTAEGTPTAFGVEFPSLGRSAVDLYDVTDWRPD